MCEIWYCVPGTAIDTSSGTGRRQPMVYLILFDEPAVMLYDAMDFAREAGSLQTGCMHTRVGDVLKYEPPIHSIPLWSNQLRTFTCHGIQAQVTL